MVDSAFPRGRLRPYVNAGPASAFSPRNETIGVEFGGKVGGGVAVQLAPWIALFSEYRYVFFPGFQIADKHLKYNANVNSHSVVLGVSFRF